MIMNMKPDKKVICILGMHRSGTSLVSRLLNICGVYLGESDEIIGVARGNARGHWEHRAIKDINDEILKIFGGRFDDPPLFPKRWERDSRLDDLKERAEKIRDTLGAGRDVWGFKDPRTCLTLPFWKLIIPEMTYVVPVADMMNVAQSLHNRDAMPMRKGAALWAIHWLHIIRNTGGEARHFTFYDNYFDAWEDELGKVIRFIDHPTVSLHGKEDAIRGFIDPTLVECYEGNERVSGFRTAERINQDDGAAVVALLDEMEFFARQVLHDSEVSDIRELLRRRDEEIRWMRSSSFWKFREKYIAFKKYFLKKNV